MTAKEMFEKLGYELKRNSQWFLSYEKETTYDGIDVITFIYKDKRIQSYNIFPVDRHLTAKDITLDELQAINKQVEELGWNNGTKVL